VRGLLPRVGIYVIGGKSLSRRQDLEQEGNTHLARATQTKRVLSSTRDLMVRTSDEASIRFLKYLFVCGPHCASGATLVPEKANSEWTVSSRRPCAIFLDK
jgi:hypothetical protein